MSGHEIINQEIRGGFAPSDPSYTVKMADQLKYPPPPADASLAETATRWLMRVSDAAATSADHAACTQWRAADPAHERAFRAAEDFWQSRELATALAQSLALPARTPRRIARAVGLAMAAMLALAVLAGGLYLLPATRSFGGWMLADHRAPLRGIAHVTLEDGSRLTLDTGAAVDVEYTPTQRHLVLRRGTIVVEASPDAAWPMVIDSGHGTVTVIGTRFLVARSQAGDRVDVQSGRVGVHAQGDVRLGAGQRVTMTATGLGALESIDPNSVADFAAGWRSFDKVPLQAVLAEIGRYRWAPILVNDPTVELLPVTARLQVSDPDRAIAALLATMPLSLQEWPGGLLRIERRQ